MRKQRIKKEIEEKRRRELEELKLGERSKLWFILSLYNYLLILSIFPFLIKISKKKKISIYWFVF